MDGLLVFYPGTWPWGVGLARHLHHNHGSRLTAYTTTQHVGREVDREIGSLLTDHVSQPRREREWMGNAGSEGLEGLPQEFTPSDIGRLLIADRHLGRGFVTGAVMRSNPLATYGHEFDGARLYLTNMLQFWIRTLEEFNPDFVYTPQVPSAPSLGLSMAARNLGIPFNRLTPSRILDFRVVDDSPVGLLAPVRQAFEESDAQKGYHSIEDAEEFLKAYRENPEKPDYQQHLEEADPGPFSTLLGVAASLRRKVREHRAMGRNPRATYWHSTIASRIRQGLRTWDLKLSSPFTRLEKLPDDPFVYYPLHVDPEASTLVTAPMHTRQIDVIDRIRKATPFSHRVFVKEHEPMVGRRPRSFYDAISKLPGVHLVAPDQDNFSLIRSSDAVVVISGTAGLEAAFLDRPAVVIGDAPYTCLGEGVFRCSDPDKLSEVIENAIDRDGGPTREEVVRYVAATFSEGFRFPHHLYRSDRGSEAKEENTHLVDEIVGGIKRNIERYG